LGDKKWRFPTSHGIMGVPNDPFDFRIFHDFPIKKTSSYWGSPIDGTPQDTSSNPLMEPG